jgi:hypothetical protein
MLRSNRHGSRPLRFETSWLILAPCWAPQSAFDSDPEGSSPRMHSTGTYSTRHDTILPPGLSGLCVHTSANSLLSATVLERYAVLVDEHQPSVRGWVSTDFLCRSRVLFLALSKEALKLSGERWRPPPHRSHPVIILVHLAAHGYVVARKFPLGLGLTLLSRGPEVCCECNVHVGVPWRSADCSSR